MSTNLSPRVSRRNVLRGLVGGTAVAVALPFLDCFLDENGTALAATGQSLPVRFGTWFWGCGINPDRWVPTKTGAGFEFTPELKPVERVRQHVNILSGFDVKLDGITNRPHITGNWGLLTGSPPPDPAKQEHPTLDVLVADVIGTRTRFRSLEVTATGNPVDSYSQRNSSLVNASEATPMGFYQRLFGPEFQDPNSASFTPDARVMTRLSVLSAVTDDRQALARQLGAADKARLDEYFTSIRQLEQQLEMQLQKPPPAEACSVPNRPGDRDANYEIGNVLVNNKAMSELMAMALACNQTRVFNMVFSNAFSSLYKSGRNSNENHHGLTHVETIDKKLGYQIEASWFIGQSMEGFATFVETMARVREGDGTLLDRMLVFAHSDSSLARMHSALGVPMMTAGTAGGRIKTGLHVAGGGDPVTRVGLTMQQIMGVPAERWGTRSMETSRPVGEILA